ncbi:hypothetical protein AVEN_44314-1 [Araneus ventricosus]|uniref:Uncharacterized protein n=1 Tax=Araneus ventricosus TaxID=182803 RepID=A0A4Y2DRW4_ARAVE|nr:hypothetical protein AVEN_44314-1 [Araneus ventricosus]
MNVYNFLALFVFIIDGVLAQSEVCNPFECFNVLDTLFQFNFVEEPCQKMAKLEKCAKTCSLNSMDKIIMRGIEEVKKDLCESDHFLASLSPEPTKKPLLQQSSLPDKAFLPAQEHSFPVPSHLHPAPVVFSGIGVRIREWGLDHTGGRVPIRTGG